MVGDGVILDASAAYRSGGLLATPIPTYEGTLEDPDNVSFQFDFEGLKILHLGDCQRLMAALADPETEGADHSR